MRNLRAIALLFVVAAVSVATVLYGGVNLAFADAVTVDVSSSLPVFSVSEGKNDFVSSTPSSSAVQPSSSAVAAGGKETALGRVIAKTINPKSAALSYGGVYMKNSSGAKIDIKTELAAGVKIKLQKSSEPQILIMHTHTTESYLPEARDYYTKSDSSRSTDNAKNMAAIGDIIAAKVEAAGFGVIHDTTQHDYPTYSGSYDRSKKTVNEYLKKYPSIKIVIDVHRDALSDGSNKTKLVTDINGKKAAQVMLVMGSQTGPVSGYPNWRQNLRLAMQFHKKLESLYPSLARPMVVASKLYNQHLTTGSMLIEIGTDANSLGEAKYSAELVGNALVALLNDLN